MRPIWLVLALLAGCAGDIVDTAPREGLVLAGDAIPETPAPLPVVEIPPSAPAPAPAPLPPPPEPPMLIALPPDTCGARPLLRLIGRPRSEIPVSADLSRRRVTCATCPMDQDLRMDRLNIIFDADTGLVLDVKCG